MYHYSFSTEQPACRNHSTWMTREMLRIKLINSEKMSQKKDCYILASLKRDIRDCSSIITMAWLLHYYTNKGVHGGNYENLIVDAIWDCESRGNSIAFGIPGLCCITSSAFLMALFDLCGSGSSTTDEPPVRSPCNHWTRETPQFCMISCKSYALYRWERTSVIIFRFWNNEDISSSVIIMIIDTGSLLWKKRSKISG